MSVIDDINSLNYQNSGTWPWYAKAVVCALVAALLIGGGYYFFTKDAMAELELKQKQQVQLLKTYEVKYNRAANLDAYRKQLDEIELSFGALLRQLPDSTEVPDLLVDITQAGLANGLEFQLFKPGGEIPKSFYAELPISITVTGSYHSLATFVSDVAAMPRIVTLHNIKLTPVGDKGNLTMSATAKTYRYVEEDA
ncbi:MAG: type 4a pilus biogenesis protein PilO [Gammaproteobacteria bacterium]|nr:type 4a pilus biogenesis protein PilO [Gammaproteobacteria bacterium]